MKIVILVQSANKVDKTTVTLLYSIENTILELQEGTIH
jgi:hypothetical protein